MLLYRYHAAGLNEEARERRGVIKRVPLLPFQAKEEVSQKSLQSKGF